MTIYNPPGCVTQQQYITMLDFRRHRRASANPAPALERRLLVLLVGSGLVVLLVFGAGNPRNWRWIVQDGGQRAPEQRVHHAPEQVVLAPDAEEKHQEAVARENGPPAPPQNQQIDPAPPGDQLFPGVRPDYLSAVRDDTVFRPAESDGWFHLFALLERTSNDELVNASQGPVGFLQLDQQAGEYRGRLVTVRGIARAAKLVAAPENAFAVKEYYQLWLQPDRAASELMVLYCLDLPEGFPLGERIEAECTATGFFFKRWAYQSQGGIATAPLVIARTLTWQPAPVAEPPPEKPPAEQFLTAIAVALALAVAVLAYVIWRGRGTMHARRTKAAIKSPDEGDIGRALASLQRDPSDDAAQP